MWGFLWARVIVCARVWWKAASVFIISLKDAEEETLPKKMISIVPYALLPKNLNFC
jgi:hypothetical protein